MKFYRLSFLTVAAASLLFGACKKTESIKGAEGRGQTIVHLFTPESAETGYAYRGIDVTDAPQTVDLVEIRRDVPNEGELNKELTVSFNIDTAGMTAYNIAQNSNLEFLPDSNFSYAPGVTRSGNTFTVTLAPGEFAKTVSVIIPKTTNLDLAKQYAFSYNLNVAPNSGNALVSFADRQGIIEIALKNKYDGKYNVKGYIVRTVNGVTDALQGPTAFTMNLVTTGPNSVQYETLRPWKIGGNSNVSIGNIILTVDPATNNVTVSNTGSTTAVTNAPDYTSRYEPSTKTFYVSYTWGSGPTGPNARLATDTLEYAGPR